MQKLGYPTNVIIDTDMGWDDILAILLLMKDPNIKIIGITVTGCGETHLNDGVKIAQGLLKLGNIDAPVSAGAATPSLYDHQFPESFREMMDRVCGLRKFLPVVTEPPDPRPAWEFIQDELANQEYQITILSLGGLTNIARMLESDPKPKIENIERLFVMGGAVEVDGNVALLNNSKEEWNQGPNYATNHYAEWNIFLDPLAAKKVFKTGIPTTLIPLDACDYVLLEDAYAEMITSADPVARLAKKLIEQKTEGPAKEPIPLPIFDPLAAMVMTGMLRDIHVELKRIDVEIEESMVDNTCGRTITVLDKKIPEMNVVFGTSEYEFKKVFSELMNQSLTPPKDELINKNVGILLFQNTEVLDMAGVFEVLAAARNSNGSAAFKVFTVGQDKKPKVLDAGPPPEKGTESSFSLVPDYTLDDHPPIDVLLIVGGQGIEEAMKDETLLKWIEETSEDALYVAGICSGVLLLAKTHLLDGLEVTTHHTRFAQLQKMSKDEGMDLTVLDTRNGPNYIHKPQSKFMTSGGVHCCIALAVHIVGLIQGAEKMEALASDVLEYTIPRGYPYRPEGFPKLHHMDPRHFVLGFSHINVIVRDVKMMDEATEFYNRVLGFQQAWSLWLPDETCKHFAHDAGFEECRVMVRFLIHPNAQIHIELMLYEFPKGDQEVHYHKTNDVGGIRHIAMEVSDAVAVYNWLKNQEGVRMLSGNPPEKLSPDPQTFFYWLDPYGIQWEMEEGRPMARVINGIIG